MRHTASLPLLVVLALVTGAALALSAAASEPRPTRSEFLISTGAGFLFAEDRGVYYAMDYAVRKALPGRLFGVAVFDNPEDPAVPLRAEVTVEADAKEIQLRSPPIRAITNDRRYNVELMLYTEADHAHLLSTHRQAVLFKIPAPLAQQFSARYGVTIR